ncbi:MAG: ComEC/Rec2 family competence protein [Bernardetiaceae bacterium]|nr:ComEC/Rec2 family competence protein [Bernardetiaceae bacterium]
MKTEAPFMGFIVAFIIGLLLPIKIMWLWLWLFVLLLCLSYFVLYSRRLWRLHYNWLFSILTLFFFIALGLIRTQQTTPTDLEDLSQAVYIEGTVCAEFTESESFFRCQLIIEAYRDSLQSYPIASRKSWLYIRKDSSSNISSLPIRYGSQLLLATSAWRIDTPKNPMAFDFAAYSANQGVYYQIFTDLSQTKLLAHKPPHLIMAYALRARHYLANILAFHIESKEAYGIASAILIGIRSHIDETVQTAYAEAGATHILAVSGLHVGIVYWILLTFVGYFARDWWSKLLFLGLVLFVLWAYAFVTGLSPSVLRAATMFSVVAIGKAIARRSNIYNTLAFSAFVLLMYDPKLLYAVGFQLSYAAVLAIVYLQPKFAALWTPRYRIIDYFWQLTCVSFAAQIGTAAIGMYYFGQFPTYFWLSNFFVIPSAFLILVIGFAMFILSSFDIIASWLGTALEHLILTVNALIDSFSLLPFYAWKSLYLTAAEIYIFYALILCFILFYEKRRLRWFVLGFSCILLFSSLQFYRSWKAYGQQGIAVYDIGREANVAISEGNEVYFWLDSSLYHHKKKIDFAADNHCKSKRLLHKNYNYFGKDKPYLHFKIGDKTLLWCRQRIIEQKLDVEADIVVISHQYKYKPLDCSALKAEQIVLDASNAIQWNKQAEEDIMRSNPNIRVHNIHKEGAWTLFW